MQRSSWRVFLTAVSAAIAAACDRQLAGIAVANGLPWQAALAAITSNPAEIFGLSQLRNRYLERLRSKGAR